MNDRCKVWRGGGKTLFLLSSPGWMPLITKFIPYGTMLPGCALLTAANPSMAACMTINIVGAAAADRYIILSDLVPRRRA